MKPHLLPLTVALGLSAALVPAAAHAQGPAACGGIDFWAVSECHLEFDSGCESHCEPLSFSAACEGECSVAIEGSCTASCEGECVTDCEVNPAEFSCEATCTAECNAGAAAHCGSDSGCRSYFEANCSAQCEGECSYVPPSASCEAHCEAACSGACDIEANAECEIGCTAELEGGCAVACRGPEGALFCDGQYIPVQDLPACLAYLSENFSIEVNASAEATITCAVAEPGRTGLGALGLLGLALGLVGIRWLRRR